MNPNKTIFLLLLVFSGISWSTSGYSQQWVPAGLPGNPINPRTVTSNLAGNTLYYGGILPADGDGSNWWLSNSIFRYSSGQWDTLGVLPGDVRSLIMFNDTLFAGGTFTECLGQPCSGIAYHDGTSWKSYGHLEASVSKLRIINGVLFAVGSFLTADGSPAPGIARRVGNLWVGVGQLIVDGSDIITVADIAEYNGQLVIVGAMTVDGIRGIFQLVGEDWLPLGPGILGGLSGAGNLMVYQDDLFVSGQFSPEQGNAGKEIMRWDGTQFHPLGSGLQTVPGNDGGTCTGGQMIVHDGLLWVAHGCNYAGGSPSRGLATWDGTQWCGVPGDLGGESSPRDMAFYHDTLFLAFPSGFGTMSGAAKFIGESYVGGCGLWAGLEEESTHPFTFHPNPTTGLLQIQLQGLQPREFFLSDALGREVLRQAVPAAPQGPLHVDLGALGSGAYLLTLLDAEGMRYTQRVVRE